MIHTCVYLQVEGGGVTTCGLGLTTNVCSEQLMLSLLECVASSVLPEAKWTFPILLMIL